MRGVIRIVSVLIFWTWTTLGLAETVRLVTGEILIVEVKEATFESIKVATVFPSEAEFRLALGEVDPASYYEILAARVDARDSQAHFRLAEFCLKHGLFTHAVVEAKAAAKLNPAFRKRADELQEKAVESIAGRLLDEAKTYIAVEQPRLGRLYLRSITERYPATKSAKAAKKLLKKLPEDAPGKQGDPIVTAKAKDRIRADLQRGVEYLKKADKVTGKLERHFRSNSKDEHLLRRVEPLYRSAFSILKGAASRPTDDELLNRETRLYAATSRDRLTRLYLEMGQLYLTRGAIVMAERYCSRACVLDPEGKELHRLHGRIIEAKVGLRLGY